jgi:hypothetical protein
VGTLILVIAMMGPNFMLGFGGGVPAGEEARPVEPAPTPTGGFGSSLDQLIKWKYGYEDDPKRRAKLDRAVARVAPAYGDILNEYGIEHPTEPREIELLQNPYKDAMNSALNPEINMRAFYRHGEPFKIFLNDSFFDWDEEGDDPRAVTLGHELVHASGMSRHNQHPRAKNGMPDAEMSQLFSNDIRNIFKRRKKAEEEARKKGKK